MAHHNATREKLRSQDSIVTTLKKWFLLKNYQYELTTSLYILTSTEKVIFNIILLTFVSMLCAAAFLYLPNHMLIMSHRVYYYIMGEWNSMSATMGSTADGLSHLVKKTVGATVAQAAQATKQTVGTIIRNPVLSNRTAQVCFSVYTGFSLRARNSSLSERMDVNWLLILISLAYNWYLGFILSAYIRTRRSQALAGDC